MKSNHRLKSRKILIITKTIKTVKVIRIEKENIVVFININYNNKKVNI
jgi:hypothetical protein